MNTLRVLLMTPLMLAPSDGVQPVGADLPRRVAPLPGVRLSYVDTGGSGPAIVLLHANTGTSESWGPQVAAFSAAGFRVIAFDRRGWGASTADPDTGPQPGTAAEDLHQLVEHLRLERFHLMGVAGGSFIALDYAAWHGERVLSLVYAASTGQLQEAETTAFAERFALPGFASWPGDVKELGLSYRGGNPEGVRRWLAIEERARQPGAPAQPLRSPNTYAKLATIRVRTLVMPADADFYAPPGLMQLAGVRIADAEWAVVPDAGHSVAWEQPAIVNDYVLRFLRGERFPPVPRAR